MIPIPYHLGNGDKVYGNTTKVKIGHSLCLCRDQGLKTVATVNREDQPTIVWVRLNVPLLPAFHQNHGEDSDDDLARCLALQPGCGAPIEREGVNR